MGAIKLLACFGGDAARQRAETKAKSLRDAGVGFVGVATVDEVEWDGKRLPWPVGDTGVFASHVVYGPID